MKFNKFLAVVLAALILVPTVANAGGRELYYQKIQELNAFAGSGAGTPSTADMIPVFNSVTKRVEKMPATRAGLVGVEGADIDYNPLVRQTTVTATIAQINAGLVVLPAKTGRTIRILHVVALVNGSACTTATDVRLQDTNGTPVVAATYAIAGLTGGAILFPNSANVTAGVGIVSPLTLSQGVTVVKTGSNIAGCTSITFDIAYSVV